MSLYRAVPWPKPGSPRLTNTKDENPVALSLQLTKDFVTALLDEIIIDQDVDLVQ